LIVGNLEFKGWKEDILWALNSRLRKTL
jgi:hypothetical protein